MFLILSIYRSIGLSIYRSIYLSISIDRSIYRSIDLSIDLSIYRSIDRSIYPSIFLSIYLSTYLSFKKAAILLGFLNFWTWQRQKRRNSGRLPQVSKLTASTAKQVWETPFKSRKLSAELTASDQCVLRFVHSICLKYCACHEKVMRGHT